MLTTRAMAGDTLSGAGSTLVAPILAEWAAAFQAFHGTVVRYDPVGSQAEIRDISSRTVDFAASVAALAHAEASVCQSCYQIPWSLSAIGIGYHVGGIGSTLRLTGGVLAEIYLGQISRWNDSRIKALNPRTPLPALRITPIYTGTSGTRTHSQAICRRSAPPGAPKSGTASLSRFRPESRRTAVGRLKKCCCSRRALITRAVQGGSTRRRAPRFFAVSPPSHGCMAVL